MGSGVGKVKALGIAEPEFHRHARLSRTRGRDGDHRLADIDAYGPNVLDAAGRFNQELSSARAHVEH
jgi:2-phospho-L-lactate transferase/gluconeogenesis factor (CofD/UPF0052 family)